jgi:hypothetical protein
VIELDIVPFTIHLARSEAETAFPHAMIRAKECSSRRTCRSWQPGQVEEGLETCALAQTWLSQHHYSSACCGGGDQLKVTG